MRGAGRGRPESGAQPELVLPDAWDRRSASTGSIVCVRSLGRRAGGGGVIPRLTRHAHIVILRGRRSEDVMPAKLRLGEPSLIRTTTTHKADELSNSTSIHPKCLYSTNTVFVYKILIHEHVPPYIPRHKEW